MAKSFLGDISVRIAGGLLAMALVVGTASAADNIKAGVKISPENADMVKDLVSPGLFYMVTHGMLMNIKPTRRVDWPPPYKEATEKYSSQVALSPDHRSMVGYVAGQPFADIDDNDPDAGVKIMWDNVFRPITSDDYDLRFFNCQSQYVRPGQSQQVIDEIQVGHYAGYDLIGRTEVEPIPVDIDFATTNRMWLFGLYPVLAPESARGTGLIRYRYMDGTRGDDTWAWQPGDRRIRRLNEAFLSSATDAQTNDPDHYSGFNPKTEEYDYHFLGERAMLASVHAAHAPEITCLYDGGASACPENWELRHLYVVAATPRRGSSQGARGALEKASVVYIDSEVWFNPYVDTYDREGQLFKTHIYWLTYHDRPVPDAKVAIYPFEREFVVGSTTVNVQGGFSTMCYLPGRNMPEHECWYINMGAVDKNFFTTQAMVNAAP